MNAQLKSTLTHTSGVSLEAVLQPEIAGAGDNPVHQFGVSATTSFEVWFFSLEVGLEWMFQTFDGEIENERAGFGYLEYRILDFRLTSLGSQNHSHGEVPTSQIWVAIGRHCCSSGATPPTY